MKFIRLSMAAVILLSLVSCKKDPVETFTNSWRSYSENEIGFDQFQSSFTAFIQKSTLPRGRYTFQDSAVFQRKNSNISILMPWSFNVRLGDEMEDAEEVRETRVTSSEILQSLVVAMKNQFIVFNNRGIETGRYTVADESKKVISGAVPFGEGVLFYMDNVLHIYDPSTDSATVFRDSRFTPHYQKYFTVDLIDTEKILYIIYGSVGMYKISAINLVNNQMVIAGQNAASSRVFGDKEGIYYISGAIGNWTLSRQPASSASPAQLQTFNDLRDIFLFDEGYIYQNSKGIFICEYGGKSVKLPFDWRLSGRYGSSVIFFYNDRYIIAEMAKIFEALEITSDLKEPDIPVE